MTPKEKYTLPLASLTNKIHYFKFIVSDDFFRKFPESTIQKADIKVNLTANKQESILLLDFSISGTVNVPCDRCSEYFDLIINGDFNLIIKSGNEFLEESEDVVIIPRNETELDLSQYIYEFILLLIPMKIEHPDDSKGNSQCNKELLKILEKYKPQEKKKGEEKEIDPRWEKLKGLK